MEIKDLQPKAIWKYFDQITKVPRPSNKEGKIRAYLKEFAQKESLECKEDETGNIVIVKQAAAGCEQAPVTILQSHMDMVCEKNNDTVHDFDNDPIETYIDGEWVKAKGTTLGADNGIGMAATLAILADKELKTGKIEGLFTVAEETGLTGALGLKEGFVSGEYLLNLDSEDEAELFVGCAGGIDTSAQFAYKASLLPEDFFFMRVDVKNLKGGHSGCDIHLGHANANKILTRFLLATLKKYDLILCQIDGGNLRNAIPREAHAIFGIPHSHKEHIRAELNVFTATVEKEYEGVEPNMLITLQSVERPATGIDTDTAKRLLLALNACPHGVMGMSRDIEGLVETSTNMASVKMGENNIITVATSQRSSVESLKYAIQSQVESVFTLAGAKVKMGDGYPGWKPNMNSKMLKLASEAYEELYQITPAVKAIHAGLECGLFLTKYPHLDMVSFGPTLKGVHSPNEMMHIPAVEKFWNHLVRVLEKIAAEK